MALREEDAAEEEGEGDDPNSSTMVNRDHRLLGQGNKTVTRRTSTSDLTIHVLAVSVCNLVTGQCHKRSAVIGCYVWTAGNGDKVCPKALTTGLLQ